MYCKNLNIFKATLFFFVNKKIYFTKVIIKEIIYYNSFFNLQNISLSLRIKETLIIDFNTSHIVIIIFKYYKIFVLIFYFNSFILNVIFGLNLFIFLFTNIK